MSTNKGWIDTDDTKVLNLGKVGVGLLMVLIGPLKKRWLLTSTVCKILFWYVCV